LTLHTHPYGGPEKRVIFSYPTLVGEKEWFMGRLVKHERGGGSLPQKKDIRNEPQERAGGELAEGASDEWRRRTRDEHT